MKSIYAEQEELFYIDCQERVKRINQVLNKNHGFFSAKDYDDLYQEFDSLYGGAKAVHYPELENLFFVIASFARHLKRNHSTLSTGGDIALIQEGANLARQCSDKRSSCSEKNAQQLQTFIDKLNTQMKKV